MKYALFSLIMLWTYSLLAQDSSYYNQLTERTIKAINGNQNYPEVLQQLTTVSNELQAAKRLDLDVKVMGEIIDTYARMGDWASINKLIDEWLTKNQNDITENQRHLMLYRQASYLRNMAKYEDGIAKMETCLDYYTAQQDSFMLQKTQDRLGRFYRDIGDHEGAKNLITASIELAIMLEKSEETALLADLYVEMGSITGVMGDAHEALEWYEKGLSCFPEGTVNPNIGVIYQGMAAVYSSLNQSGMSLDYMYKSVRVTEATTAPNSLDIAQKYFALGTYLFQAGKLEDAILYLNKALSIVKGRLPEGHPILSSIYNNLAAVHGSNKEDDKAIEILEIALRGQLKFLGEKHEHVAMSYQNLSSAYIFKSLDKSLDYIDKAVKILFDSYGEKYHEIASAYSQKGKVHIQRKELEAAVEAFNSGIYSVLDTYKKQSFLDTFTVIPTLLDISRIDVFYSCMVDRASTLTKLYHKNADLIYLQQALAQQEQLIAVVQKVYQRSTNKQDQLHALNWTQSVYPAAIQNAILLHEQTSEKKYVLKALKLSEANKSILLLDALKTEEAHQIGGIADSLLIQEKELKERLEIAEKNVHSAVAQQDSSAANQYRNEVFDLNRSLEAWEQIVAHQYPDYHALKNLNSTVTWEVLQDKLASNTTLLEYTVLYNSLEVFVVNNQTVEHYTLAKDSTLQLFSTDLKAYLKHLSDYKTLVSNPSLAKDSLTYYSARLYKVLMAPLEKSIQGKERLIVIPDKSLAYLPFESLIVDGNGNVDYDELHYLLEDYAFTYAYSGQLLYQNLDGTQSSNNNVLAMSCTYTNHQPPFNLTELDGAAAEVAALGRIFEGDYYSKEGGTEKTLKEEIANYGILHLATHGIVNYDYPMASCLLMSLEEGEKKDDGILYAYEITNLPITANMVVLSACETGMGKIHTGEGVMSLARAFMYAGAPSVVMSLWQVNDGATSIIMSKFYTYLKEGIAKDIALQKAKLYYLNSVDGKLLHPAFWAAFVHLGNYEPLPEGNVLLWIGLIGLVLATIVLVVFLRNRRG